MSYGKRACAVFLSGVGSLTGWWVSSDRRLRRRGVTSAKNGTGACTTRPDLRFRTKGQLVIDVLADALAFDFVCHDEAYGSGTDLASAVDRLASLRFDVNGQAGPLAGVVAVQDS
jgi:hypothetical protein